MRVKCRGYPDTIIGSFYRRAKNGSSKQIKELEIVIEEIYTPEEQTNGTMLLIGGDFNLGGITWKEPVSDSIAGRPYPGIGEELNKMAKRPYLNLSQGRRTSLKQT